MSILFEGFHVEGRTGLFRIALEDTTKIFHLSF